MPAKVIITREGGVEYSFVVCRECFPLAGGAEPFGPYSPEKAKAIAEAHNASPTACGQHSNVIRIEDCASWRRRVRTGVTE